MTETFSDGNRRLNPPIDSLQKIMEWPGACAEIWDLESMIGTLPTTRRVMAQELLDQSPYPPKQRTRIGIMSRLLLDRIGVSLEEIIVAAAEEKQSRTAPPKGHPMAARRFTFGDITYLSATTMIHGGISPDVLIEPNETMRRETERYMLFAAPAVCNAFNGAIAVMSLPLQRRHRPANHLGGPLSQQERPRPEF